MKSDSIRKKVGFCKILMTLILLQNILIWFYILSSFFSENKIQFGFSGISLLEYISRLKLQNTAQHLAKCS